MDNRTRLQKMIKEIIDKYSDIKVSTGEVEYQKLIDDEKGIYELKMV